MNETITFHIPVAAMGPGSHSVSGLLRGTRRGYKQTMCVDGTKWSLPFLDDSRLPRLHRRVHAARSWWREVTARHVRLSDESEPRWWGRWRKTYYYLTDEAFEQRGWFK